MLHSNTILVINLFGLLICLATSFSVFFIFTCKKRKRSRRCCCLCCKKKHKSTTDVYAGLKPTITPIQLRADADKEDRIRNNKNILKGRYEAEYDTMKDVDKLDELDGNKAKKRNKNENVKSKSAESSEEDEEIERKKLPNYNKKRKISSEETEEDKSHEKENSKQSPELKHNPIPKTNTTPLDTKLKIEAKISIDDEVYRNKARKIHEDGIPANPRDPKYDTFRALDLEDLDYETGDLLKK